MTLESDLKKSLDTIKAEIINQREEIVTAFIAKFGCDADQLEQVVDMSDYGRGILRWSIRRKAVEK
jgi:hypothetical protein